ncbi:sigma-54-dependent Fis family transcriptional regulator [Bacillus sp. V59.32b]|uniref:sigma-54 interaction domain-containing protein n=1 Tax=Bacillus sp. V59.32b TaxID=1758642 RepID=UPI000E3C1057|nr:sigma 54-interacting transcriptional regulator [Bacillus sp. V59.32b]RFU61009.1 PAS domain-containing protein [Bacillus sp. V59.32b]
MCEFDSIGNYLPVGLILVNYKGEILYGNPVCQRVFHVDDFNQQLIKDILPATTIIKVIKEGKWETPCYLSNRDMYVISLPLITGKLGLLIFLPADMYEEIISKSPKVAELKQELQAVMNLTGELVTITDGDGIVSRVNNACEQIMGVKEFDFIGKSAFILEQNGIVNASSTRKVIEEKRTITMNQVTKSGRRLLVHAHPIFNEDGTMYKIINISKDVTEIEDLQEKLAETTSVLDYYQQELNSLKKKDEEIVVKSKAMEKVYELVSRVADVDATIFLHGETGVGKEVMARKIHQLSNRKDAPFVKVNCGAIPETIMESELFGYSKGTFTGANREGKKGLALAANKGTLFLDEIGELPLNVQAKLLQLLQEKQFTPLGDTKPVQVDVRFIAATNRNLEQMVKQGTFREDLYYRLFVVPITIPPLSERKEDIPFLISHFLDYYGQKYKQFKSFEQEVIQIFTDYVWNGNVRELQNTIERLVLTVPARRIKLADLPDKFISSFSEDKKKVEGDTNLKQEVERFEKQMILGALETSSTLKEASMKLGVDASTMTRKVKKYGIIIAKLQV